MNSDVAHKFFTVDLDFQPVAPRTRVRSRPNHGIPTGAETKARDGTGVGPRTSSRLSPRRVPPHCRDLIGAVCLDKLQEAHDRQLAGELYHPEVGRRTQENELPGAAVLKTSRQTKNPGRWAIAVRRLS